MCDLAMPRTTARKAESYVFNDLTGIGISQNSTRECFRASSQCRGGGEYDIMTYYYNLLSNIVSLISLLLLLCFPGMCCFAFGFGLAIPIFSFLFLIKYFPRGSDNG